MKSIEEKILEARNSYIRSKGRDPECVVMEEYTYRSLDPRIYSGKELLIFGMHVVVVDHIPHDVIRCGRMP